MPSSPSLPWVVYVFFLSFYIACGASMGEHNEGPSETQLLRRDVRTSITGMRSGDLAAECLSPSRQRVLRPPSRQCLRHCLLMRDEFAPSIVVDRRTPLYIPTDAGDMTIGALLASVASATRGTERQPPQPDGVKDDGVKGALHGAPKPVTREEAFALAAT